MNRLQSVTVLGTRIDCTSYDSAVELICQWAKERRPEYVCAATVNTVMEAYDDRRFQEAVNNAGLVTADGMPLVWALRLYGCSQATRVYGPDLTEAVLAAAEAQQITVGFYGGTEEVLGLLRAQLQTRFPSLKVAYMFSPPFRPLTTPEEETVVLEIQASRAMILFVGIGTPKQDYWMAAHVSQLELVTLGVGAAFDFIAGIKPQAPRWMMKIGAEWMFRLITEPRRLWKRYAKHNPRFLLLFLLQLLGSKLRAQPQST